MWEIRESASDSNSSPERWPLLRDLKCRKQNLNYNDISQEFEILLNKLVADVKIGLQA